MERLAPWIGLLIAGSCALPEMRVDPDLGEDGGESGEGSTVVGGTSTMGGKGGTSSGTTGGKGGTGGTSGGSTGGAGGSDETGGSSTGGNGGSTGGGDSGGAGGATGTGGNGGTGGTDATGGSGGSVGTGGTESTGGTGGTTGGTGGTTGGTGGTTGGTGGTTGGTGGATGGTGGTGGATGGTGGATGGSGGSTGGTGGTTGGTGGATGGTGGATGGTGGATGGTGGATGGSGGACPTVAQLFPASGNLGSLDGRLETTPCVATSSDDCTTGGFVYNGTTTPCSGNSLTVQQDFPVGGSPGQSYSVTIHFYGIVEPKNYGSQVTRESGSTRPMNDNTGATPVPWAYTTSEGAKAITSSDYNTYEIHVIDQNGNVSRQYFLNSDTSEGHWTYVLDFERTIPVIGGGKVRIRQFDPNCRIIKNCYNGGQGSYSQCAARARSVTTVNNASPPPTGLVQPGLGLDPAHSGQWTYIDVVSVACGG